MSDVRGILGQHLPLSVLKGDPAAVSKYEAILFEKRLNAMARRNNRAIAEIIATTQGIGLHHGVLLQEAAKARAQLEASIPKVTSLTLPIPQQVILPVFAAR